MRRKTKEKINHLINIVTFCSIIMAIFSVILLLQKKIFLDIFKYYCNDCWYCFFLEFKKRNEVDSHDNN